MRLGSAVDGFIELILSTWLFLILMLFSYLKFQKYIAGRHHICAPWT
jgi:hypothetical protein